MQPLAHCATVTCTAPAEVARDVLADAVELGTWALGCWGAEPVSERLVRGTSLLDGSTAYVRVEPDQTGTGIDFAVGPDPDQLVQNISARVQSGSSLGYAAGTCLVTLLAWRPADMSDERWSRLVASHEVEIFLLRTRIEEAARVSASVA